MTVPWPEVHTALVRGLARPGVPRDIVDDLVQDAAERLVQGLPRLRDEDRLGPYVQRVVRSVWVDHLRRRRPASGLPEDLAAEPPPPRDLAPTVASWLPALVQTLPDRYRDALRLSELEGLTQREVAARLGLSQSGARSRVQRGRALLRERLEACCAVVREGAVVVSVQPRSDCCEEPSGTG